MPIWYGGDYNPEQWPEEIWDDDVRLMRTGGISMATVGVFSWAKLEPSEGEFDFGWLDRVLDKLHAAGIRIDLATATASPPPWLTHHYPEVLPVTENGVRLAAGSRQQYCPSSPVYRKLAARLVTALAERYADHPGLELWHINNEYGCHVSHCYCDISAEAFREWLRDKYDAIENLNRAWGTAFWSQQYGEFAEVYPPSAAPSLKNPAQLLDFDRFSSDELLACFRAEAEIVRRLSPGVPVTTNFMGFFKPADYWKWAAEVDVVSDDSYPDPADPLSPAYAAMQRDLMRSLRHGQPWILMEQAPGAVNWRRHNAPKLPGQQRAWSYQSIARGADGILFFQWRQSVAGAEKFHSGLVPHAGTDTRIWREVEQLGSELGGLESVVGTRVLARTAIVFDWETWWGLEQKAMPGEVAYLRGVFAWYRELWRRTVTVDFVRATDDLAGYDLVIVPSLLIARAEAQRNLDAYTRAGGTLLVTYQTAIMDENARILDDGYLGRLQDTLGVWVEEFYPPAGPDLASTGEAPVPPVHVAGDLIGASDAATWAERVHARGAEVLDTFADAALAGSPALTRNAVGNGAAWYVATQPTGAGLRNLIGRLLDDAGIGGVLDVPVSGVEAVRRGEATFLINHAPDRVVVPLAGTDIVTGAAVTHVILEPNGVAVVTESSGRERAPLGGGRDELRRSEPVEIAGLPAATWIGRPAAYSLSAEGTELSITAAPGTDWIHDALTGTRTDSAAALLVEPSGDFALSARVDVSFQRTYDAGVLCLYQDADTWAKLCFEYSPDGHPMVVSVVTRDFSDDVNSVVIDGSSVMLRIIRTGPAYAFHYSTDGQTWQFVRLFRLGKGPGMRAGFLSQSPLGGGAVAGFSEIALGDSVPADLRDGT